MRLRKRRVWYRSNTLTRAKASFSQAHARILCVEGSGTVMAASTKVVLCQACGEEASALDRSSVSGGGGAQNVLAVWTELFSVEIIMPHRYYSHLLRLELRVP